MIFLVIRITQSTFVACGTPSGLRLQVLTREKIKIISKCYGIVTPNGVSLDARKAVFNCKSMRSHYEKLHLQSSNAKSCHFIALAFQDGFLSYGLMCRRTGRATGNAPFHDEHTGRDQQEDQSQQAEVVEEGLQQSLALHDVIEGGEGFPGGLA